MVTGTLAPDAVGYGRDSTERQGFDRWIFVLMALLLLATVLIGFIPSSLDKVAAIQAGERAPFLPVLHVHAFLMGTWILLLIAQTSLVATNHRSLHMRLGMAAVVVMPAMVITGIFLVPATMAVIWNLNPAVVPAAVIDETKIIVSNIALLQIRVGILFPIMVGLALYYRKSDSATHKRLMILATALPIPAAVDRILWLPNSMPNSPIGPELYTLLLILPLFAYDLLKKNGIPRAYFIWMAGWLPTSIVLNVLWNSEWWLATAPKIVGVESW